jgi:rod shape-determining protein MreD
MRRFFLYSFGSIVVIILHTTLIKFLAIGDIVPDILVIWIVYIAIREGQAAGTVAGFALGLALDLLSGHDGMLGLASLAKAIAGFTAGYFYNENKTLQTLGGYQFLVALGVVSLAHNLIYFIIFLQGTDIGTWGTIVQYGIPTTLYTVAFGLLPMFAFARKYLS